MKKTYVKALKIKEIYNKRYAVIILGLKSFTNFILGFNKTNKATKIGIINGNTI